MAPEWASTAPARSLTKSVRFQVRPPSTERDTVIALFEFSVKDDPIFIAPALDKDKAHFVSYYGNVYSADFSGDEVKVDGPWSLLNDEDKAKNWVPGGYNLVGLHRASGRMYVFMHPDGKEGTHKFPAAEIWVMDTKTKKRVARVPGSDALYMTIDQQRNLMLTLDGGNVNVYDISQPEPKLLRTIEGAAAAVIRRQGMDLLELHQPPRVDRRVEAEVGEGQRLLLLGPVARS